MVILHMQPWCGASGATPRLLLLLLLQAVVLLALRRRRLRRGGRGPHAAQHREHNLVLAGGVEAADGADEAVPLHQGRQLQAGTRGREPVPSAPSAAAA